eukprot:symbB.v1.2.009496.t1/scaffold590.1/size183855/8
MAGISRWRCLYASLVWLLFGEARDCMLLGGNLDLFREDGVEQHTPRCVFDGCPQGSDKVYGSCVAPPLRGQAREIALTLHAPCQSCAEDGGVELAGHLWMALATALQVPLQETQVSILLMRDVLWNNYPLQHFTLQRNSEGPLVTPHGGVLFNAAVHANMRRCLADPGNAKYLQLLALHPAPLLEATGWSDGINVFEIAQQTTQYVNPMTGQEPPTDVGSSSSSGSGGGDPRIPSDAGRHTTAAPSRCGSDHVCYKVTKPRCHCRPDTSTSRVQASPAPAPAGCQCRTAWLGDGQCHDICNNEVCGWDRGDCGPVPSRTQFRLDLTSFDDTEADLSVHFSPCFQSYPLETVFMDAESPSPFDADEDDDDEDEGEHGQAAQEPWERRAEDV